MSLYDAMGSANPQQLLQQLRANPAQMLKQHGLNIPTGMNNPQQIVKHLIQSGQVPQSRLQQAFSMMRGGR